MRIAGRMAGQRLAGSEPASAARGSAPRPVTIDAVAATATATARTASRATGSLARGVGGFFRPFRRIGNILFLEVVGVFFFVFVLIFAQTVWRARASYLHGPDHQKFLVAAALMLLFLYLSASSFWRARKK